VPLRGLNLRSRTIKSSASEFRTSAERAHCNGAACFTAISLASGTGFVRLSRCFVHSSHRLGLNFPLAAFLGCSTVAIVEMPPGRIIRNCSTRDEAKTACRPEL